MSVKKNLILVKFGGSAITDKSTECTYLSEVTRQLLAEVKQFLINEAVKTDEFSGDIFQNSRYQFIFVHGAGSFGHIKAKRFGLDEGYNNQNQFAAVSQVHYDVRKLNSLFMSDLLLNDLPGIAIPPFMVVRNNNKSITNIDFQTFDTILSWGLIPISFGDVVIDDTLKFSICSGDVIIQELAKRYKPTHVIFLTGVDGLCTKNPKIHDDAQLIKKLTEETFNFAYTRQNVDTDVTGGIFQKCKLALELTSKGIKTYIINGTVKGRFRDALMGHDVEGTVVE